MTVHDPPNSLQPPAGMGLILDAASAASLVSQWQAAGRTVVFTNGCFDLLHRGHVEYLARARALGDCLVVGLNGDESVRQLKGPGRPVVLELDRAAVLAGLRSVDVVVIFRDLTAVELVSQVRPDIYVKGGDWATADRTPPEGAVVAQHGGQVVFLPYLEGHSTTGLLAKIQQD